MSSLAELFATVGYKVDDASIKKYDAALETSKKKTEDIVAKSEALLKRMSELEEARNREEAQVKRFLTLYDKLIEKKGKSVEEKKADTQRALGVISLAPLPKAESGEEKRKRLTEDWKQSVIALNAAMDLAGRGFSFVKGKIDGMLAGLAEAGGKAGDIADLSERTGIATDTLQELGYAAEQNGSDMASLATAWKGLSNKADSAVAGSKTLKKTFKEVGVSAKDLKSGKLSLDDAFGKIADKFKAMEDGPKKAALAMDLFGGAGGKLIPLLNQGGAGIKGFREEARKLGVVISGDGIKALDAFDDQSAKLKTTVNALRTQALAAIVPQLSKVADRFQEWLGQNREKAVEVLTQAFGLLVKGIEGAAAAAKIAIDVFGFLVENSEPVVFAISAITAALVAQKIAAIATSIGSIAAAKAATLAWLAAAWPFIAIGVAVAAVIKFFPQIAAAAKYVAGVVVEFFGLVADTAVAIWEGIKTVIAFYVNMYVAAFKALWGALKAAASAVLSGLKALFGFYADMVRNVVRGVTQLWNTVVGGAKAAGKAIADAFRAAFKWIIDKVEWLSKTYDKVKSRLLGAPSESQRQAAVDSVRSGDQRVFSSAQANKTTTIQNSNQFTITSNAADPKAVAVAVKSEMANFWNGKMRETVG